MVVASWSFGYFRRLDFVLGFGSGVIKIKQMEEICQIGLLLRLVPILRLEASIVGI